jgi:hypothetical protein
MGSKEMARRPPDKALQELRILPHGLGRLRLSMFQSGWHPFRHVMTQRWLPQTELGAGRVFGPSQ